MTTLWLTEAQAQQIVEHALHESPREACGIIIGTGVQAQLIIPIPNKAANPLVNFEMEHAAFVKAMFQAEKTGQQLIGLYHSHPNSAPLPSQSDIAQANYPDTVYLIVSLQGTHPRLAAWDIRLGQVMPAALHIGQFNPQTPSDSLLSPAQKIAIIISALLAFIIMLIVSISLLPPAPPLPVR